MTDFRPTRTCPHRLCLPLHFISGIGALLFITMVAPITPWILGSVVVGGLLSVGVYHLVHRQTMADTIREEVQRRVTVTARPGWARAAVSMDALWALGVLAMLAVVLAGRGPTSDEAPPGPAGMLLSLAVGVVLMVAGEGLHRRAVRIEVAPADRATS